MKPNNVIFNILGNSIRKDYRSKNKTYLGYDITQKSVGPYNSKVYIILNNGEEISDENGGDLYFSTYNQAKYYIENNLR